MVGDLYSFDEWLYNTNGTHNYKYCRTKKYTYGHSHYYYNKHFCYGFPAGTPQDLTTLPPVAKQRKAKFIIGLLYEGVLTHQMF